MAISPSKAGRILQSTHIYMDHPVFPGGALYIGLKTTKVGSIIEALPGSLGCNPSTPTPGPTLFKSSG